MEITRTESQLAEIDPETSNTTRALAPDEAVEAFNQPELPIASSSKRPQKAEVPLEPLEDIVHRRVNTIREGDNVLLRLPSDAIKAVVASQDG